MIVLDTNVVSELMRDRPDRATLAWLDRQPPTSIWTTAITVLECRFGIEKLAPGRRRDALVWAFEGLLSDDLSGRILAFGHWDADAAAKLMADRRSRGQPGELRDGMIAGMVKVRRARLATRNTRHFCGDRSRRSLVGMTAAWKRNPAIRRAPACDFARALRKPIVAGSDRERPYDQ